MSIVRQRRRVRVIPRVGINITSVNAGTSVFVDQASVDIVGTELGAPGAVQYHGSPLTVLSWTPTLIRCVWPDVPFNANFAGVGMDVDRTLTVIRSDGARGTRLVRTQPKTGDFYRQITGIANPGIFANDVGVTVGMYYYWRTLTGTITNINAIGQHRGATAGATGKYAVWDGATWTNTANSLITL